jgi:hypothetical protein
MSDILNSLLNQQAQQQSWFNAPLYGTDMAGAGIARNGLPLYDSNSSLNANTDPSFMQGMLGYTKADGTKVNGWGMPALSAASSLFQGWIGLEQLDIAKKSLKEQKRQFDMNWDAQRTSTNRQLEDRQAARAAFNPDYTEDTASYMAKWGIK